MFAMRFHVYRLACDPLTFAGWYHAVPHGARWGITTLLEVNSNRMEIRKHNTDMQISEGLQTEKERDGAKNGKIGKQSSIVIT